MGRACPVASATAVREQAPAAQLVQQEVPQAPQLFASVRVSTSQPFAGSPSQSAKPGLHAKPHAPAVHVATALATVAVHATPQPPQFAVSSRKESVGTQPPPHEP